VVFLVNILIKLKWSDI